MHMKAIPADIGHGLKSAGSFVGSHKMMFLGGAAVIAGVFYFHSVQANTASSTPSDSGVQTIPVTTSLAPTDLSGGGGAVSTGLGTLDTSGLTTGTSAPNSQQAVTDSFTGAFGSYSGLDPNSATNYDLAQQNLDYQYNSAIYADQLNYNGLLASMNLNAYNGALSYGNTAAISNNSVATALIQGGQLDGFTINSVINTLYGDNPVTPHAATNLPSYVTPTQTYSPVAINGTVSNTPPAIATAGSSNYDFAGYVESYPDLAAYYHADGAAIGNMTEAQFGAQHYANFGIAENRVLPTAKAA